MSDSPVERQISRRRALKKAAAVGGALWAVPVIQSVNMTRAWATTGSRSQNCYTVDIDINRDGEVSFHTEDPRFRCLSPEETGVGPTTMLTTIPDGAGGYIVTILGSGGRIVEAFSEWKTGSGEIVGDACTPGVFSAANAMRFPRNVSATGKPGKRCDIELTFCVWAPEPSDATNP